MKLSVLILLSFLSLNSYCQKDSTHRDTIYQINLTKAEFYGLINAIKMIDEKPSIINKYLQENIYDKTKLIPNKEEKKK